MFELPIFLHFTQILSCELLILAFQLLTIAQKLPNPCGLWCKPFPKANYSKLKRVQLLLGRLRPLIYSELSL